MHMPSESVKLVSTYAFTWLKSSRKGSKITNNKVHSNTQIKKRRAINMTFQIVSNK